MSNLMLTFLFAYENAETSCLSQSKVLKYQICEIKHNVS